MSGDQLDLDAIEARGKDAAEAIETGNLLMISRGAARLLAERDVPALVAEVRRLREERDTLRTSVAGLKASLNFKRDVIEDLSATIERLESGVRF